LPFVLPGKYELFTGLVDALLIIFDDVATLPAK